MKRLAWAILHHDGIRQYVRVPSDNGGRWIDLECANLCVSDQGEDVVFKDGAREFRVLRANVQTHLTVKPT